MTLGAGWHVLKSRTNSPSRSSQWASCSAGVLAAADLTSRDRRLATLMVALALDPVPVDDAVAQAWAGLRVALRDAGRRLGVNDSWIAATAIALGLPIVTQDVDYTAVPSLRVVTI